jgi:actin-like ATPase involved in cell morphogenesis
MRRRVDTASDRSHYRLVGMGYGLGVDIGTTWTAAAIARSGSEPQVLSLGGRTAAVPTVVHVLPDRSANVGDAAERRAATDPDRIAREFKRRLGDTTPVLLGGEPWSPETLMGTVLRWVLARATELEGEAPEHIVVTHPANWGPLRRELIEQAIAQAGVDATYVTEPEAAAAHYAAATRVPEGAVVAVYDLGGGTFDATVLRKTPAGFDVLGKPEGVERLGGLDFDAAVLGHVTQLLGPAWTALDAADPATSAAVQRLRHDCVLAKEALSEDADATIPVTLPTVSTEVRLTRGELESMIRTPIEQSADSLGRALASAGIDAEQVDRILLVGGSSRIPLVSQVLTARFSRPLALDTHPKHAVALGAARLALGPAVAPSAAGIPAWTAPPPATAAASAPTAAEPVPVAAAALAEPGPAPAKGFPRWIPVVAVLAVLGVVAALLLGGGGDDDADVAAGDEATTTTADPGDDTTTSPPSDSDDPAAPLVGEWSYEGAATQCAGLADDDCAAFAASFTSTIAIRCDDVECQASLAGAGLEALVQADDGRFLAGGDLPDDDGFQCVGEPDPTMWLLEITNVLTQDDQGTVITGFEATVTLESNDGSIDGNSCPTELVVAEGSATPFDPGSGDAGDDGDRPSVVISLDWPSNADLDLTAFELDGTQIDPLTDGPSPTGGVHSGDDNHDCPSDVAGGFETITWPADSPPPPGTYTVQAFGFGVDQDGCGAGDFVITVQIEGQDDQVFEGTVGQGEDVDFEFVVD